MGLDTIYYPRVYVVRNKEEFFRKICEVVESHRLVGNERPLIKLCSELSLLDLKRLLEGMGP
jgi:hypothetical protein